MLRDLRGSFRLKRLAAIFVVLILAGCKVELNSNLDELDANQALAKLLSNGIFAEKEATEDGTFKLLVNKDEFAVAVEILQSHGLPKRKYSGVEDVFAKDGIVTSPMQEWIRYNHALSQEISGTIASLPGVVSADVHLAQAKQDAPFEEVPKPTASVMVQMNEAMITETIVPKIKQLVSFAVEELEYERVSVMLTPVKPVVRDTELVNFAGLIVHVKSVNTLRWSIGVSGLVVLALICGCVVMAMRGRSPSAAAIPSSEDV